MDKVFQFLEELFPSRCQVNLFNLFSNFLLELVIILVPNTSPNTLLLKPKPKIISVIKQIPLSNLVLQVVRFGPWSEFEGVDAKIV